MKKFVSFALMLAVLLTCVIVPVSADTAENASYFEPSYAAADWTVTGDATIDSNNKTISLGNTDSATYKPGVMKGDFILTADICNEYTSNSNITWLNVAGVKFDFKGDGIVSAGGADSNSGYRAGDGWFYVTIVYKSAGEISLYCINPSTGKRELVSKLSGSEYANKNEQGAFSVGVEWTPGKVKNIKMYKPLSETYLNTFESDNALDDFEIVGGYFKTKVENDDKVFTSREADESAGESAWKWGCHFALLNKYTEGSFSLSMDYASGTANRREFLFNSMTNGEAYAFVIDNNNTISLVKGKISDNELKDTTVLASAGVTDKAVTDILGDIGDFGYINNIRIDYDSNVGGMYVYLNHKSKPVLSVSGDEHKDKMGQFGIWLWYQADGTVIDDYRIEPYLPGFEAGVPQITLNDETGKITGTAKITNTSATAKNAVVILAVYAPDGSLADVKTSSVNAGICRDLTVTAESDKYTSGCTAKCFVFDSLDTVTPLATAASYPAGN